MANRFDNKPTIGLAIFLLSDANALGHRRRDQGEDGRPDAANLPRTASLYEIGYDTTPFMRESIKRSLQDAPGLDHPRRPRGAGLPANVAGRDHSARGGPGRRSSARSARCGLVGFGFNNLTLFGLVLAVGIVVDDAIVVVEAVQHQLARWAYAPKATRRSRAMHEVAGPDRSPSARCWSRCSCRARFSPASSGCFFRQFALTIAISTIISTFNSLTLSPGPGRGRVVTRQKRERPDVPTRRDELRVFGWLLLRSSTAAFDLSGLRLRSRPSGP